MIKNIFGVLLLFSLIAGAGAEAQQENDPLLQRVIPVACHDGLSFLEAYTNGRYSFGNAVIIETGIAITVHHLLKEKTITANAARAEIIATRIPDDLMMLKIESGEFNNIPLELDPSVGSNVITFIGSGKWAKRITGKVAKVDNKFINLSGVPIQRGDSGTPVYSTSGKLVGIICKFPSSLEMEMGHSAVLVSAKRIAELMKTGSRMASK